MPRVVIFHLLSGSPPEVEAFLQRSGFAPKGLDIDVSPDGSSLRENSKEEFELLLAQTRRPPSVDVFVEIPYSRPASHDLRALAELLLTEFGGVAIDETSGYDHAWSLSEIRTSAVVDGRRFFDNGG